MSRRKKYGIKLFFSGTSIGPILSIVTAGILAKYFGWEAIFYVHGSLACIWLILWAIFISNTPSDNYFISESEMIYITSNCSCNKNLNNSMVLVWFFHTIVIVICIPLWNHKITEFGGVIWICLCKIEVTKSICSLKNIQNNLPNPAILWFHNGIQMNMPLGSC